MTVMGYSCIGLVRRAARHSRGARGGQTALEYLITAGMLIASVAILAVFLYTFKEYGGRVLDLVASEYP